MLCPNCGSSNVEIVGQAGPRHRPLLTSDTRLIRGEVSAQRIFCNNCSDLGIVFTPEDSLMRFYSETYDIADEIQNHPIVVDRKVISKHDRVLTSFFSHLDSLPETGRFLEIACGRGHLSRVFKQNNPGFACTALDPSNNARKSFESHPCDVYFIQDFFRPGLFGDTTFDVIVAHGFLNRTPVLPTLLDIRRLSHNGTILSLDVMDLEYSECAPFIWDHTHMYPRSALKAYLEYAGFEIEGVTNCATCDHLICKCVEPAQGTKEIFVAEPDIIRRARSILDDHEAFWETAFAATRKFITQGKRFALFGAGMYNAVLATQVGVEQFEYVIDEIKAGSVFFGLNIIDLQDAGTAPVILCTRPAYVETIVSKLKTHGIDCFSISPMGPV